MFIPAINNVQRKEKSSIWNCYILIPKTLCGKIMELKEMMSKKNGPPAGNGTQSQSNALFVLQLHRYIVLDLQLLLLV